MASLAAEEVAQQLKARFPDAVEAAEVKAERRLKVKVKRERLFELCAFLKEKLDFDHVSCVSGVDYKKHLTVVYHLYSYRRRVLLQVDVDLPRENPTVASVTPLWQGANWHEREQYDFFGIVFEGHPGLERIMTPPGWEYHPLRKEYRVSGEYVGT